MTSDVWQLAVTENVRPELRNHCRQDDETPNFFPESPTLRRALQRRMLLNERVGRRLGIRLDLQPSTHRL